MDIYKVWLSMVIGACAQNGVDIVGSGISPKQFYNERKSLYNYEFFTKKQLTAALSVTLDDAAQVLEKHEKLNIKILCYTDDEYPDNFKYIQQAPVVLYYKGDISLLQNEGIAAVIGTRNPDRDGILTCEEIVRGLASCNAVVASGLAQGLDGVAHKTALENGGKTIAFIGTALDRCYPAAHREMQKQICEKGCVISEYYIGQSTPASTFLERNRLIAACAKALCVVQAKDKSGSLATTKYAEEYNKAIFALPGSILNSLHDGTNHLILKGATAVSTPQDIPLFLGLVTKKKKLFAPKPVLSEEEEKICKSLGKVTQSTNQIFQNTHIPMVRLKALLTKLEMDGVIKSQSPGVYFKR